MVIIVSRNEKFINFASSELENFGYATSFFDYFDTPSFVLKSLDILFLIHSSYEVKDAAQAAVSDVLLNFPKAKILVAAEIREDTPSRYMELEGSDRQLVFPFTPSDLTRTAKSLISPEICVKELQIENGQNEISLLGRRLKLSKTNRKILRLIAKAYPNALQKEELAEALGISQSAVTVHISSINKAADRVTERRLIIFKNGYKLNELM